MNQWITTSFSWFYVLSVAVFLIVLVVIALSDMGKIKLGPDHSQPEYSNASWFAMLFTAGMGIGLMFFGVAEPVMHYVNPPTGDPQTIQSAQQAMGLPFSLGAACLGNLCHRRFDFGLFYVSLSLTTQSSFGLIPNYWSTHLWPYWRCC